MKQIIGLLFVALLSLSSCKEQKKETASETVSEETVKIEQATDALEAQTKKLEEAEAELDAALKELDF